MHDDFVGQECSHYVNDSKFYLSDFEQAAISAITAFSFISKIFVKEYNNSCR
jgi:hypothetical protein